MDPLELRATPERIRTIARAIALSDQGFDRALDIVTRTPDASAWQRFLSRTLAALSATLFAAAAVLLVAYNWERFGHFGKFGLAAFGVALAALMALRYLPRLTGQLSLFVASVLVGALLALYGQTYQTGADPYGLFLTWALLILPWTVAARFGALWVLWIALVDVSILLYWSQVVATRSISEFLYAPLLVAAIHSLAVSAYLWQLRSRDPWVTDRWPYQSIVFAGYVALFIPAAALATVDRQAGIAGLMGLIAFLAAVLVAVLPARRRDADLFPATVAVAFAMAWAAVLVGRVLFKEFDAQMTGFLLLGGFIVAELTFGLRWYRASRSRA